MSSPMKKAIQYLIVGAGPAGLQLAYFLERSGQSYLVLEKSDRPAAFFRTFPRRRELISFNKVNSIFDDPEVRLRWDWNSLLTDDYSFPFSEFSRRLYPKAIELVRYLEAFAKAHHLNIQYNTEITDIRRIGEGGFEVRDVAGKVYDCRALIMATGFGKPYIPEIEGIELTEDYETVSLKRSSFEGQRILILGKGNSAFEIADVAIETAALVHIASPSPLTLAWKTRHPGHVRANHTRILDTYQLKLLNGALDCKVDRITRLPSGEFVVRVTYVHADGEVEELVYDRVVRCTGFRFDSLPFTLECQPETVVNGKLPAITPYWESANVTDLFFAGTLMQGRDFKRSSSAFIDGFRYNIRTLSRYLESRYTGANIANMAFEGSPADLSKHILERACRTSGLWTQFGYLSDVLIVGHDHRVEWYEELPFQAVQEGQFSHLPHYYSLTFEWGEWGGDVMAIERHPRSSTAYTNVFLHPILRRYAFGEMTEEHHILEDLFGVYAARGERGSVLKRSGRTMMDYHREEHEQPLELFLARQFARPYLGNIAHSSPRGSGITSGKPLTKVNPSTGTQGLGEDAGWDG